MENSGAASRTARSFLELASLDAVSAVDSFAVTASRHPLCSLTGDAIPLRIALAHFFLETSPSAGLAYFPLFVLVVGAVGNGFNPVPHGRQALPQ